MRMTITDLIPPEHERSPSPPPIYDSNGIRQNTREVRMKEKINRQRNGIIEELLKRDPTYQPPTDYKPEKKSRKLYIPYKEYPDYNFIGLIIGPRGNTHKRMQQETNTVIAIRGKGSVKEGARGDYGEDDDLHVLVQGDTQDDVDRAAVMVER
jgi:splicing factor 1